MKQFSATLVVNNGRFDRKRVILVQASNIRVAFTRAAGQIRNVVPARQRVESATIKIVALRAVAFVEEPRDHTDDVCPCGDVDCSRPFGHPVEAQ